jgi:hypothetical protein
MWGLMGVSFLEDDMSAKEARRYVLNSGPCLRGLVMTMRVIPLLVLVLACSGSFSAAAEAMANSDYAAAEKAAKGAEAAVASAKTAAEQAAAEQRRAEQAAAAKRRMRRIWRASRA